MPYYSTRESVGEPRRHLVAIHDLPDYSTRESVGEPRPKAVTMQIGSNYSTRESVGEPRRWLCSPSCYHDYSTRESVGEPRLSAIHGIRRWLHRVWDTCLRDVSDRTITNQAAARNLQREAHATTKQVTTDMRAYKFNTSIAALMSYVNGMNHAWEDGGIDADSWNEHVKRLLLHLAPLAPHIADELWTRLGHPFSIHNQLLPEFDPEMLTEDTIHIVVQVNGKVRANIDVPSTATEQEIAATALADNAVQRHVANKPIRKAIYVPGKIYNVVV